MFNFKIQTKTITIYTIAKNKQSAIEEAEVIINVIDNSKITKITKSKIIPKTIIDLW